MVRKLFSAIHPLSYAPIPEKAMPVVLADIEQQKLWLEDGDESLLEPYEGEMEFDQLPEFEG